MKDSQRKAMWAKMGRYKNGKCSIMSAPRFSQNPDYESVGYREVKKLPRDDIRYSGTGEHGAFYYNPKTGKSYIFGWDSRWYVYDNRRKLK